MNTKIQLWGFKTYGLDIEIENHLRQLLQLLCEHLVVPRRPVRELVVGQHVRLGLGLSQVVQEYYRDPIEA